MKLSEARAILEGAIYADGWPEVARKRMRELDEEFRIAQEGPAGPHAEIPVGSKAAFIEQLIKAAGSSAPQVDTEKMPFMADRPGEARRFA